MPGAHHPVTGEGPTIVAGRYAIYDAVASGGMATVHVGRLLGSAGFLRTVAIKRLHQQFANNRDFAAMFLDEARLAARVQHPNVVQTLDVVVEGGELLLVMEYVRGVSLSQLTRTARDQQVRLPPPVVVAILSGVLRGLHAAHEATDEKGAPLDIVHRDVSPQNVLVGVDGTARVLDFGIAKAAGRLHETREGEIKGKLLYMAPEQLAAEPLSRVTDVYAAGIVLFETLTSVRMFAGEQEAAAITKILKSELRMPSSIAPELAPFDAIVRRAAAAAPDDRYPTAHDMACDLERIVTPASPREVAEWVMRLGGHVLDERAKMVAHVERSSTRSKPPPAALTPSGGIPVGAPPPSGPLPTSGAYPSSESGPISGAMSRPSSPSLTSAPGLATGHGSQPSMATGSGAHASIFAGSDLETRAFATGAHAAAGRPRSAAKLVAIALAACLLVTIGVIVVLLQRPHAGSSGTSATASASGAAADDTPPATERSGAAPVVAPVVVLPPSAASTASAPEPSAEPSTTARPRVVPKPVAKPKVSCDPPYTIDKKGHRHFIPECVQ